MPTQNWSREFIGAVTVCDTEGIIIDMNQKSIDSYKSYGGAALIGKNILDCHPEPARAKLASLMETRGTNVYTIEKNGIKKLIYQSPWFEDGEYKGLVELSLEIPENMRHYNRK